MTTKNVHVRIPEDTHQLLVAEAARAGQSLSSFITTAAIGRALHARGLRGEPSPFDLPRRRGGTEDPTS